MANKLNFPLRLWPPSSAKHDSWLLPVAVQLPVPAALFSYNPISVFALSQHCHVADQLPSSFRSQVAKAPTLRFCALKLLQPWLLHRNVHYSTAVDIRTNGRVKPNEGWQYQFSALHIANLSNTWCSEKKQMKFIPDFGDQQISSASLISALLALH